MYKNILLNFFVLALAVPWASPAYNVETDATAYRIVLWKNGDYKNPVTVTGNYAGLSKDGKSEHKECSVQLFKEEEGKDTLWRISVVPKADYGVYAVSYPLLFLPKLPDGYLVYPRHMGMKMANLFNQKDKPVFCPGFEGGWTGDNCERTKDAVWFGRYPQAVQYLQMLIIENEKEGVMLWTRDGRALTKDFIISNDLDAEHKGKGLRAEIIHYPENTGQPGTGYKSPYPVVTTSYEGGWYNAAQIYRAWALKQPWCARGKIYNRKNTPEWFKNIHVWTSGGWFYDMDKGFEGIKKNHEMLKGREMGVQLQQWQKYYSPFNHPDYFPPHDIPAYQRILAWQSKGLHFAPYIVPYFANTEHRMFRYIKDWAALNAEGKNYQYFEAFSFGAQRDYKTPPDCYGGHINAFLFRSELERAWKGPLDRELVNKLDCFQWPDKEELEKQKKMLIDNWGKDIVVIDKLKFYLENVELCFGSKHFRDYAVWMAGQSLGVYGTHMQYFDCFPRDAYPCFAKNHGHPIGYGEYISKGQHDVCAEILEKYPSAILVGEAGAEYLLDVLHVTYLKDGVVPDNVVPLFSTIYQGYMEYNSFPVCPKDYGKSWENAEDFTAGIALGAHLGYMQGSCWGIPGLADYPLDDVRIKFLNDTIDTRLKYRDYIAAGRRLKDPEVKVPPPREIKGYGRVERYPYKVILSPVQVSKWEKNNDETNGLLLISNSSAAKQTATVEDKTVELDPCSWKGIEVQLK